MTRHNLERRIDALEIDISGADAQTRDEMLTRLKRVVVSLDTGAPTSSQNSGRRSAAAYEDQSEDAFDNMPI